MKGATACQNILEYYGVIIFCFLLLSFLKKHEDELPKVRLHSLRHSNATLLIAEGTDICTVSQRLGHAQTSTTLNVYAHALKSKDADAADRLDAALSKDNSIVPFPSRVS